LRVLDEGMSNERRRASSGSPYESTVGFSRAVRVGNHIFISGTAPICEDGTVVPEATSQARRCWEIVLKALEELGGSVSDVVRTRHYLTTADADVVDAVSSVHGDVFGEVRPASTMVVVAALLDHRWLVEIELEAIVSSH